MKGLVVKNKTLNIETDLKIPTPKTDEVLVKIKYSSIHSFDLENVEGKNKVLEKFMGVKQFLVRTGIEFSGIVETDGKLFKKGDYVFGYPDLTKEQKSHQEYISINENHIGLMPKTLDFHESAAIPVGALTSLVALEDLGKITEHSKILINGAAGGLGVYAIQIAKIFGAHITAIAGPNQELFLSKLGADEVINYKEKNIEELETTYDVLFDLTAKVKFHNIKKLLKHKGIFIPANPFSQLTPIIFNFLRQKKVAYLLVAKGNNKNLSRISDWIDQGKLKPVIDKTYLFEDFKEGFERLKHKNKRGRIILKIN